MKSLILSTTTTITTTTNSDDINNNNTKICKAHSQAIDQKHIRTAEFLRESIVACDIVGRYGHLSFLTKSELSLDYLANS